MDYGEYLGRWAPPPTDGVEALLRRIQALVDALAALVRAA